MALDATQVHIGITGAIYKAPIGSTAPTDSTTALDAAFIDLGYCTEDGVSEQWDDSVDDIVAWQNATTIRSSTTESTLSLGFTLVQLNGRNLVAFHPGSTMTEVAPTNFRLDVKPRTADPSMWVLDVVDGLKVYRLLFGNAELVQRGEVMYRNGEPIGLPFLLRAYPDTNGNLIQKFSNDVAWSAS